MGRPVRTDVVAAPARSTAAGPLGNDRGAMLGRRRPVLDRRDRVPVAAVGHLVGLARREREAWLGELPGGRNRSRRIGARVPDDRHAQRAVGLGERHAIGALLDMPARWCRHGGVADRVAAGRAGFAGEAHARQAMPPRAIDLTPSRHGIARPVAAADTARSLPLHPGVMSTPQAGSMALARSGAAGCAGARSSSAGREPRDASAAASVSTARSGPSCRCW